MPMPKTFKALSNTTQQKWSINCSQHENRKAKKNAQSGAAGEKTLADISWLHASELQWAIITDHQTAPPRPPSHIRMFITRTFANPEHEPAFLTPIFVWRSLQSRRQCFFPEAKTSEGGDYVGVESYIWGCGMAKADNNETQLSK